MHFFRCHHTWRLLHNKVLYHQKYYTSVLYFKMFILRACPFNKFKYVISKNFVLMNYLTAGNAKCNPGSGGPEEDGVTTIDYHDYNRWSFEILAKGQDAMLINLNNGESTKLKKVNANIMRQIKRPSECECTKIALYQHCYSH